MPDIQLKANETVLLTVRATLIPWWSRIMLAFVWLVLPFFLLFPLFQMQVFGAIIFIGLLGSGLIYAYRTFLLWHGSVCVITDLRVVDIDRRGIFSRLVSEVALAEIEDVSYAIKGLVPTVFRYGTVTIKVKGSTIALQIYHVRRPLQVHDLLNELRQHV